MVDKDERANEMKNVGKNIIKGFTYGSILDPDMTEAQVNKTPEFTMKQVVNHYRGKEKLTKKEITDLKKAAKYIRF